MSLKQENKDGLPGRAEVSKTGTPPLRAETNSPGEVSRRTFIQISDLASAGASIAGIAATVNSPQLYPTSELGGSVETSVCETRTEDSMKLSTLTCITAMMLFAALAVPVRLAAQDQQQEHPGSTFTTFDATGAGTGPGQGTIAVVINPAGAIEGLYLDANNVYHGFLRSPDGAITTLDAPGAGTGAFQGTQAYSMNQRGAITGYYTDAVGLSHGFVRAPDGTFTIFDAPGAGIGGCSPPLICSTGTQGASINSAGEVAGQYVDASGVFHGFLRYPDGTITTFDAPGAGTGASQGTFITFADGINPEGAIAGAYADAANVVHGFVRAPDGTFTTFDPHGSVFTDNSGINPEETVTSFYLDASGLYHGYVRAADGTFTLFDAPGAGTGPGQGTIPANINAGGAVTGQYIDASGVNHGFLRTRNGAISTFDVPGAGTGSGQGTVPISNNPANAISGFYIDASGVNHGFLRTP